MPPSDDLNFAALKFELSRLRNERGWSYDQFADRSGVSRRHLIDLETGGAKGSLETWYRIAKALDVDLGRLVRVLSD